MSSHYRPKYARSDFIPIVDGLPDIFDSRYVGLAASLRSYTPYTVRSGDHLPNIAKQFHGTTTTYWIIAQLNGIVHPLDIEPGQIIHIPRLQDIDNYLNLINSRIGEELTI